MVYVCNECGNYENFRGYRTVTKVIREEVTLDKHGEEIDAVEYDEENADYDEIEDIECSDCGELDPEELSDSEFEEWKKKHFNVEGDFFRDELTEEQQTKTTQELEVAFNL